jgi:uncharacterized membrane protein
MITALWWWLVVQVVALCATPLCLALFRPLADRGYGLSKAFGLLLFGYVAWLIGLSHVVHNSVFSLLVALALVAGGSYLVWRRDGEELKSFWRRRRGLLLLEEGIFLGGYLLFLAIRVYNSDINGTEKFMDFAFMNAVTRSATFPPLDPWLAPSPTVPNPTINYYHFGYLIQGLLLMLTGVAPAEGFNLALSLLFGLAAAGIFSLGYGVARDLVAEPGALRARLAGGATAPAAPPPAARAARRVAPTWSLKAAWPYVAAGALGLYMLLIAGNLWTALRRIDGSGLWQKDFWQGVGWNATRVLVIKQGTQDVDYTINEFPAFSFLLGDLHPHVLALPFAILAVGLAYSWLMRPPHLFRWALAGEPLHAEPALLAESESSESVAPAPIWRQRWERAAPVAEIVPGALILGSLYFLNSWDFPAYFTLALAAAIAGGVWWWKTDPPPNPLPKGRGTSTTATLINQRSTWPGSRAGTPSGGRTTAAAAQRPPPFREGLGVGPPAEDAVDDENDIDDDLPEPAGPSWGRAAVAAGVVAVAAGILFAPFILTFKPPVVAAEGSLPIGLLPHRSLLSQFSQFWGAQLLLIAPAVLAGLGSVPFLHRVLGGSLQRARAAAIVAAEAPGWEAAVLLGGAAVLVALAERVGCGVLVLCLLFAAGAGWAALRALDPDSRFGGRPLGFAFGAICLGALLLAACEVVFIRDFYGGALQRMNTVFKLYYQAWLLFAAGGSVAAFWLFRRLRRGRGEPGGQIAYWAFVAGSALLLLATWQFPYKVTLLRTNNFQNVASLDGMDWMRRFHPEDYAAAQWLREHAASAGGRAPVILEASGGPYSEYARMATQTGFPTVLGWDQHENLWRGAAINAEVDQRKKDVDAIYTSATMTDARPLLDKYDVAYIVVGYLERAPDKYGSSAGLAKFDSPDSGLQVAFRQGQTTIYARSKTAP